MGAFIGGFILGGLSGIVLMAMLVIGRDSDK
jgi:hypothetical protein